jgi:hypothetical protein
MWRSKFGLAYRLASGPAALRLVDRAREFIVVLKEIEHG